MSESAGNVVITLEQHRRVVDWIAPGASGVARIHPLVPAYWDNVRAGLEVAMYEGSRVVGRGEVLEVVGPTADDTSGK